MHNFEKKNLKTFFAHYNVILPNYWILIFNLLKIKLYSKQHTMNIWYESNMEFSFS
jgi:hypothetical protein